MHFIPKSIIASVIIFSINMPLSLHASITRTYHFPPNQPVTIQNPLYWDLDTHCTINSNDEEDTLVGKMVHRSGKINGNYLKQGQDMAVTVHPNEDFHLEAEYKAVVQITNYGESTVSAKCRI
ncbi:hypothetical protein [Legionella sp. W05-934-2]|uniref:hypothetical protein n=1 Tax=Legionella sp. W05-934-2 TaxID=1198649 RepID=UPI0034627F7C